MNGCQIVVLVMSIVGFAAEKSGLFHTDDIDPPHVLMMLNGQWEIARANRSEIFACLHARSETGPLCICNAILSLKGKA